MKRGSAANREVDRWVGTPLLVLTGLLRRRRRFPARESVARVGVMTSTTIGDTLLASPALVRLKKIWPRAELVFFAAAGNRAAAEMLPAVDRISTMSLTDPRSVPAIRREKPDVMIDFSAWQRITALLSVLSGAPFVAGFRRKGQHRHFAFDLTAEHRGDCHETANFSALAGALENAACLPHHEDDEPAVFPIRPPDPTKLEARWKDSVVFHCWANGTHRALREWPAERWEALGYRLRERWPDARLVLTGGPDDLSRCRPLATALDAEIFSVPGGLHTVAALLQAARLVVSVNTGTMHLAALLGAPTVGLTGPTRKQRWGPIGPRTWVIEAPGADCGYLDLGWEWKLDPSLRNPGTPSCMERISVDQVMEGVKQLLG